MKQSTVENEVGKSFLIELNLCVYSGTEQPRGMKISAD